MRTKKAAVNSIANILSYIIILVPNFLVRKVFLVNLGENWLGVNSLFANIIGLLSIMELGIGSAIVFSLYKPFEENNKEKVQGYLYYYKKFYSKLGKIILIVGLLLIPFLNIFINNELNMKMVTICYIICLCNTYITYIYSYKSCILNVAQEEFKLSISSTISKLIICILQIMFIMIIPSFVVFLSIQFIINLAYYIILNIYIDKKYSWINSSNGYIEISEKKSLTKNIKALFFHKIGSFVVDSTDNLMISYFINLSTVAKFNSYNMIISTCRNIVFKGLSGVTASIGNLLVTKDKKSAYDVHKKLFFLSFWIVSFICIMLFNVLDNFIIIWLGKDQLLDRFTVVILIFNLYFIAMRSSVERFKESSGNFSQDKYAPVFEAIINLGASIILVKKIGLPGIFLGTLISNLTVIFWTKPLIVYKYVFNVRVSEYYKMYFKYLGISIIPLVMSSYLCNKIIINNIYVSFLLECIIITLVVNSIYIIIFRNSNEFNYYKNMLYKLIRGINKTVV